MRSANRCRSPTTNGVDDFPVIIQDKRLDNFGTPEYSEPGSGGFVGDTLLVNGAQSPYVEVSRGWVRLRLLNASNSRRYQLQMSDGRALHVISGDQGFFTCAGVSQTVVTGAR
ncbi:SufI protein [Salmonella bongori]|nr:SufI protein [Salmonella bongori]